MTSGPVVLWSRPFALPFLGQAPTSSAQSPTASPSPRIRANSAASNQISFSGHEKSQKVIFARFRNRIGLLFQLTLHRIFLLLIPELIDRRRKAGVRPIPIRIWSAACSTGQEAYSTVIVLKETLCDLGPYDIRILGTDISDKAVAQASYANFSKLEQRVLAFVSPIGYHPLFVKRIDSLTQMVKTIWIPLMMALLASGRVFPQSASTSNAPPSMSVTSTNASVLPSNLESYVPNDVVKLRVGDKIAFQIKEDRDPARFLTIADSGEVDFPYIGRMKAADKTCKQLIADCKTELEKDYYYKATVIVALEYATPFLGRVYVWGQVKNQGAIDLRVNENLRVSQAILRAGGFADFAKRTAVKLIRAGKTTELNMVEIIDKGRIDKDVILQPDDTIVVPSSPFNF